MVTAGSENRVKVLYLWDPGAFMAARRLIIFSLFVCIAVFQAAADGGGPAGGMAFGVRALFLDTAAWTSRLPDPSLPALPPYPVLMHGGAAYVNVNEWFRAGLQGYGIVHGAYEETGMTEFSGDIVGFFADFRYPLFWTFTAFGGGVLSCGRFYFNAMSSDGNGLRASSGAVYVEPYAGIGFTFLDFFEIRAAVSYIVLRLFESPTWMGPGTPVTVSPDGPIVSITLGLPLPSSL
jgi:hypothetical protein